MDWGLGRGFTAGREAGGGVAAGGTASGRVAGGAASWGVAAAGATSGAGVAAAGVSAVALALLRDDVSRRSAKMSEKAGMILATRSEAKSCVCASPRFGEGLARIIRV
jgi:hypothetical protein